MENQYLLRSTLSVTMLDVTTFTSIAKLLKENIGNYDAENVVFHRVFIGMVMLSLFIQVR